MKRLKLFNEYINENNNWIDDATKNKGALRKKLGKKEGEKITIEEIDEELDKLKRKREKNGKLSKMDLKKERELHLAKTLMGMKK